MGYRRTQRKAKKQRPHRRKLGGASSLNDALDIQFIEFCLGWISARVLVVLGFNRRKYEGRGGCTQGVPWWVRRARRL